MPNGGNGDGRNVTMDPINGTRQLRLRFSGGIDPLQETLTRTSEGSIAAKKETKNPQKNGLHQLDSPQLGLHLGVKICAIF